MQLPDAELRRLEATAREMRDLDTHVREALKGEVMERIDWVVQGIGRRPPLVVASLCILGWRIASRLVSNLM